MIGISRCGRVEVGAVVVLGEDAAVVDALRADLGLDLVGRLRPTARRARDRRGRARGARRGPPATQHITFDATKCLRIAAHLPDALVGFGRLLDRRGRRAGDAVPHVAARSGRRAVARASPSSRAASPTRRAGAGRRRRSRYAPGASRDSRRGGRACSPSDRVSPPMPYMICRSNRPAAIAGRPSRAGRRSTRTPPSRSRGRAARGT